MAQASFTLPKQSWYLIVWSQNSKNWAKMNKIVQKWQFQMTFYTTMKMEVGISLNGPNKWFPPYWFLIAQHMKYPKIIMRAPVHFFWVVTTLGLQCYNSCDMTQPFKTTGTWTIKTEWLMCAKKGHGKKVFQLS